MKSRIWAKVTLVSVIVGAALTMSLTATPGAGWVWFLAIMMILFGDFD